MINVPTGGLLSLASIALLVACSTDSPTEVAELRSSPELHSFANSEWSNPENLGPPVSSACTENGPFLSTDGLTLYFASSRPGGFASNPADPNACQAGNDIWVAERDCLDCPWSTPVNPGLVINTAFNEGNPSLSTDGHLLFFVSNRPGGAGQSDVYVSRRANPKDDFGWGPPELLGSDVNTAAFEAGPDYLQSAEEGSANLYFARGQTGNNQDIYYAPVNRDGETLGPAVLVDELSDPLTHESIPTVRADGREIFFWSNRPGGPGAGDLWTSTRRSVHHPWSGPENLGAPVNSPALDRQPSLSHDGRTLLFSSFRAGSLGEDIWMTTRTPSGK